MQKFNLYRLNTPNETLPEYLVPGDKQDDYLPSKELAAAVNVAIALNQPLLLTGEPGTGKTELAKHVARYFNLGEPFVFTAQTTSVKKDLFYTYNALGHFQAANMPDAALDSGTVEKKYIRYEALGAAIIKAIEDNEQHEKDGTEPKRSVVLIDEIDKAPRDLPNDLLTAIEKLTFEVPEIPGDSPIVKLCPKHLPPILIITSNSEKNLPDAFLRRVVYHHINFPDDPARLLEILQAKQLTGLTDDDIKDVIAHFKMIRDKKGLDKKPATAELIAWATLLPQISPDFPFAKLQNVGEMSEAERELLYQSYGVLAKSQDDLKKLTTVA